MTKEQRIILENRVKDVLPGLNPGEIEKLLPILRKAWAMGYFDGRMVFGFIDLSKITQAIKSKIF